MNTALCRLLIWDRSKRICFSMRSMFTQLLESNRMFGQTGSGLEMIDLCF